MNQEHQKGIEALKNCLQLYRNLGREICELHLENAGITNDDLQQFLDGNKCMTEAQFHGLANILMQPNWKKLSLIEWLLIVPAYWGLVNILEPSFSLKKHKNGDTIKNVKAILDYDITSANKNMI